MPVRKPRYYIILLLVITLELSGAQKLYEQLSPNVFVSFDRFFKFSVNMTFFDEGVEISPKSSCLDERLISFLDIPIFYINLDNAIERRNKFERYFGCANLTRVPGVLGRDHEEVSKWLAKPILLSPGLAEHDEELGESEWDGIVQRPLRRISPMFLGALGCTIAHIRAMAAISRLNLPYALIMEDDMTPELFPTILNSSSIYKLSTIIKQLPSNWSAVELSAITGEGAWKELMDRLKSTQVENMIHDLWLASNGAYLISSRGIQEVLQSVIHFTTRKLDLTKLRCINADLCLTLFFKTKFLKIPPVFIHSKTYENYSESNIVSHDISLANIQHFAVELSRSKSMEMAEYLAKLKRLTMPPLGFPEESKSTCFYPIIQSFIPLPIYYINYDENDMEKRNRFLQHFGCLNLTRIPGIKSHTVESRKIWLSHALKDAPGSKYDNDSDNKDLNHHNHNNSQKWNEKDRIPHPQTRSNRYFFELDRSLSHLRAAAKMLADNIDFVIILEDDITSELLPYWINSKLNEFLLSLSLEISVIQLNVMGDITVWNQLPEKLFHKGPILAPDVWFNDMGAYILSIKGAYELINRLRSNGKFNIKELRLDLFNM